MPHYNRCVPGCTNSFRNAPHLQYHRIPKDEAVRKVYKVILKNDSLKLDSASTRICSVHFEGGQKLSRSHLPSIFPCTKPPTTRRELKRISFEETQEIDKAKKQRKIQNKTLKSTPSELDDLQLNDLLPETNENGTEAQTLVTGLDIEALQSDLLKYQQENLKLKDQNNKLLEKNSKLVDENNKLLGERLEIQQQVKRLKYSLENFRFDIEKYKDRDEDIAFYSGFPDYKAMLLCFKIVEESANNIVYEKDRASSGVGRPRSLTKFQEFTLVMMRLRLGLLEKDLAHRFNVSRSTVSKVTRGWIRFLRSEFEALITIPSREVIKLHMPDIFKSFYPNVVAIVDCTEFEMEKPSSLNSQSTCYSSYKSRTTMKALLGITPSGALCFVSELFPGSTSDKEITAQSGLLKKLQPRDEIMADKGFNCADELASVGAALVIPAFLDKKRQFSKQETNHNKVVASLRVHVERLMERIKNWHIFDHRIQITLAPIASVMLFVVCALSNFHPPLIN